jgi:hypothetical protein
MKLKSQPDDFQVEEITAISPSEGSAAGASSRAASLTAA